MTVSWVVVGAGEAFGVRMVGEELQLLHQVTLEVPGMKLVPLTVRVIGVETPAVVPVGEMAETVGPAMVRVAIPEPAPVPSLTLMDAEPGAANCAAGMVTVRLALP